MAPTPTIPPRQAPPAHVHARGARRSVRRWPTRLALPALALTVGAGPAAGQRRAAVPIARASMGAATAAAEPRALPASTLRLRIGGAWHRWWRADSAPARWNADHAVLARTARWHDAGAGVQWAEVVLGGSGEAWRTRVVVARLDLGRTALRLDTAFAADTRRAAWTVERVREADSVRLAVNAGQFRSRLPWGWTVMDGREWLPPGAGPLATAVVAAPDGGVRLLHAAPADSLRALRRRGEARWAFQSYPTLLAAGAVPEALRRPGAGVDLAHRDARAALGIDAAGRLLVAVTRFDGLGGRLSAVPFGLTVPEMAAVMGALGATDAVMLDGGISAQLLLRDAAGEARTWPGLRRVPLALVATARR